jgi:hypothetical protein
MCIQVPTARSARGLRVRFLQIGVALEPWRFLDSDLFPKQALYCQRVLQEQVLLAGIATTHPRVGSCQRAFGLQMANGRLGKDSR